MPLTQKADKERRMIKLLGFGSIFLLGSASAAAGYSLYTWQFWIVTAPLCAVFGYLTGRADR